MKLLKDDIVMSRVKIIITIVFLISLSVALYIRRPKDMWEPKWGEGLISCSENAYYKCHILAIIQKWKEASGIISAVSDIFQQTLLVIDLDENAIWLEKEGNIIEDYYIAFPEKVKFEITHFSKKYVFLQTGRIIFRNTDYKTVQASSEQFTMRSLGNSNKLNFSIIDTREGAFQVKGLWPGSISASTNIDDLVSPFIVTKDEYEQYIKSLANTSQNDKDNIQSHIHTKLEENQAAWMNIGKKLFIEIEKQVHKTGYQLNKLDVSPGKNFITSNAFVIGYNYNIVNKILNKNPYADTNLGIIHVKDNIWYVASKPELKKKGNEQQIKLEFLVYPDSAILKKQEKEYINQGRKEFKKQFNGQN